LEVGGDERFGVRPDYGLISKSEGDARLALLHIWANNKSNKGHCIMTLLI